MKLDYTIESPEERKKLVEQILQETPEPSAAYLEILANYLILCMEKQEKKQKKILTENRLSTINKRESSYEGLAANFQYGEDAIQALIDDNKNTIFRPKIKITDKDIEEIPTLATLRQDIANWEASAKRMSGRDAYLARKALIEMRKDQYVLKQQWRQPLKAFKTTHVAPPPLPLDDTSHMRDGEVIIEGVSLMNPTIVSTILQNYSKFAQEAWGRIDSDLYALMQAFDELAAQALRKEPILERIVELKVDGIQNAALKNILADEFNVTYTEEYLSTLWRKRIPNLIAEKATEQFLRQACPEEKQCGRCGEWKPAHPLFFNRNRASKDGYYSICKSCRNKKRGVE